MNESEREAAFPIHIELGSKRPDMFGVSNMKSNKEDKPKKVYPRLFLSNVEGLEKLPEEGCMLVDFKIKNMSVSKNDEDEPNTTVELEIHTICLQDDESDDPDDIIDEMTAKVMKKKNRNEDYDSSEDEDEDDETEE